MATSLMGKAKAEAPAGDTFKNPDISQFIPEGARDAVDRIVAAGMKLMFSPEMREELMAAVQSPDEIPKKIADNVTGLMLTMDGQSQGGIPVEAIFPALCKLAGEAANVLVEAGQNVTQEDFNDALLMIYVANGKKLGGSEEELMQGAQDALGGADADAPPEPDPEQGAEPPMPEEEDPRLASLPRAAPGKGVL